jgi:hypothetical protein
VVLMVENLLCKLITWKEGVDAEPAMEHKAPELLRRLARCEDALRGKVAACNMALFNCEQLQKGQAEKERKIERLKAELKAEKKAHREVE